MSGRGVTLDNDFWWFGLAVSAYGVSRSYSTSDPFSTGMGDCLRAGKPPRYVTSHPGQLSLLPAAGREMSTGQSALVLCDWGVKTGMAHSVCV